MSDIYDFRIDQGASLGKVFTIKNSDGTLFNLAGYSAVFEAKKAYSDDYPVISLTTENGGIILGGAAGTVTLVMSADETAALDFNQAIYNLDLISPDNTKWRILRGTLCLIPGVIL